MHSSSAIEEGFHVGDGCGHAIRRQTLQERLAVALLCNPRVEEDQDSAVFEGADQAAETLLQSQNGGRDLVVEEGVAAGFFDSLHASLDYGIIRDSEREAVDDDAAKRFAL